MATGSGSSNPVSNVLSTVREHRLQFVLVAPTVLWFVVFLLVPLAVIAYFSFLTAENFSIVYEMTLTTWANDVFTATNMSIFLITFAFGLATTALTLLLGYPVAYYLRFHVRPNVAFMIVLLSIIPFWISGIIRSLAWFPILGRNGVINQLLTAIGVVQEPVAWLLFSPFAMIVGFLANYVVFMYVPIYAALLNVDEDLLDASGTLRGGPRATFRHVTLPLSMPGVAIGVLFVFVLSLGDFVVPQTLSGGQTTVPGLIFLKINQGLNWPVASALSIALLVVILGAVGLLIRRVDITESF
jgi:ABC-type spermidine/putrescine transport system permease subunit I